MGDADNPSGNQPRDQESASSPQARSLRQPGFPNPLARVLAAVVNAHEQDAARVARLLHDEVGQTMSAAGLYLDVLRLDVEAEAPHIAARIQECQKILEQAVDQVRSLSYEMNPQVVERAGLGAALDRLVGNYRSMTGQRLRLQYDSSARLPPAAAAGFYRLAECAVDNAVNHSGGEQVEIFVRRRAGAVELEVRDDGAGFDLDAALTEPAGLGLLLMQCYAGQAGLQMRVETAAGEGTIVKALFPDTRPDE